VRNKKSEWAYRLMTLPGLLLLVLFCYVPMGGIIMAFENYVPSRGILGSEWVGLENFRYLFSMPDVSQVIGNTVIIAVSKMVLGIAVPVAFAILLNEVCSVGFRRVVQTIVYLPNFISWVVAASLIFTLFGSEGVINRLIQDMGLTEEPVGFLSTGKYFWWLITMANIWKGVGWSAIIYLSAMAGIDRELYQAGAVDGLGRFGMVWHITLPGISTTILLLWILRIGGILNAGFDQQLLIGNAMTREYWEVIDTYAYRYGIQLGRYSYATAVGLFKSVISILLIFVTNRASKKLAGASIF